MPRHCLANAREFVLALTLSAQWLIDWTVQTITLSAAAFRWRGTATLPHLRRASERAISTTNRCSYFSSLVAKSTSSICPLSQGLLMSANCGVSSRQQLSFAAAIATWLYLDKRLLPEFQHVLPNVRWDNRVTPQQRQRKLRKIDAHNDSEIARWRNSCSITTYYLQNSFIQASHALTDCMNNVTTRHELLTLLRTLMQRETSTKYVVDHSYEREAMTCCHWNYRFVSRCQIRPEITHSHTPHWYTYTKFNISRFIQQHHRHFSLNHRHVETFVYRLHGSNVIFINTGLAPLPATRWPPPSSFLADCKLKYCWY